MLDKGCRADSCNDAGQSGIAKFAIAQSMMARLAQIACRTLSYMFFGVNSDELVMASGQLIRGRGLAARVKIWIAHHRSALMEILNKIFRKEDVQGPIESDPQLLFKARKLEKVDRTPEPPGDESREIDTKNSGNAGAATDRGQQTKCLEPEGH